MHEVRLVRLQKLVCNIERVGFVLHSGLWACMIHSAGGTFARCRGRFSIFLDDNIPLLS